MKNIFYAASLSFVSVFLLTGCNPAKEGLALIKSEPSAKTAADLGNKKLDLDPDKDIPEYKRNLKPFAELPKTEAYLNKLLNQIIVNNKLESVFINKRPYVRISVDTSFNAVTLTNGLIVINTGKLTQLDTEAELQAVLAHELMHLLNEDHIKDELQKVAEKGLHAGMQHLNEKYLGASDNDLLTKGLPDLLGQQLLDDLINAVAFTKWNREQELDADLSGVNLMHEAGVNEKYMLKFLSKRRDFEANNPHLFSSQNEEKSKTMDTVIGMFSGFKKSLEKQGLSTEQEDTNNETPSKIEKDSITSKYYSADTRYEGVTEVLISQIGRKNLNRSKTTLLSKSLPDYQKLKDLMKVREVNEILASRKKVSRSNYHKALKIVKKAQSEGLKNNSYLNLIRAGIYQSRYSTKKYAPKYRALALNDENATLGVYANVIAYYDSVRNEKKVFEILNKINTELDYPNNYLPQTIKYQVKYNKPTDISEAQCVRTLDVRVARGCQLALGRALKVKSSTLIKTVATENALGNQDNKNSDKTVNSSPISNLLPF